MSHSGKAPKIEAKRQCYDTLLAVRFCFPTRINSVSGNYRNVAMQDRYPNVMEPILVNTDVIYENCGRVSHLLVDRNRTIVLCKLPKNLHRLQVRNDNQF